MNNRKEQITYSRYPSISHDSTSFHRESNCFCKWEKPHGPGALLTHFSLSHSCNQPLSARISHTWCAINIFVHQARLMVLGKMELVGCFRQYWSSYQSRPWSKGRIYFYSHGNLMGGASSDPQQARYCIYSSYTAALRKAVELFHYSWDMLCIPTNTLSIALRNFGVAHN